MSDTITTLQVFYVHSRTSKCDTPTNSQSSWVGSLVDAGPENTDLTPPFDIQSALQESRRQEILQAMKLNEMLSKMEIMDRRIQELKDGLVALRAIHGNRPTVPRPYQDLGPPVDEGPAAVRET